MWHNSPMVKKFFMIVFSIILILIILAAALVAFLTFTEYIPEDLENVTVTGSATTKETVPALKAGYAYNIMTWNIGFGALGDNADFILDGGTSVMPSTEERVNTNISNITSQIKYQHPSFVLLQEVDRESKRSYNMDQMQRIASNLPEKNYTYTTNIRCSYIPYPWPPIGNVESGLMTLSDYDAKESTRIQLPIPFKWPVRVANFKRCLMMNRYDVEGTDKELVIFNLHLEAYDDGTGKEEQTRIMRSYLESEVNKGNYVIAGGDFNQTFSSIDTSKFPSLDVKWHSGIIHESDFNDMWQFVMDSETPSCRSLDKPYAGANHEPDKFQFYLIDGFIVSSNIEVKLFSAKDMGFQYTDHNPVFMRFKLKA